MSEPTPVRLSGNAIIDRARVAERDAGAPMFMGIPERWYDPPHFRCAKGHVSKNFLKAHDGDRCFACDTFVNITFPEDREDGQ